MKLLLHPDTAAQIDAFLARPRHALLIEGPAGSGKASAAYELTADILNLHTEALMSYAYFMHIVPVDNVIPIATVREMQQFMRLKTLGSHPLRRALLIEDAHRMTVESQNALLKLLEEPPEDTVIVFTASPDQALLPTIYSRAQHITIKSPAKQHVVEYFLEAGHDEPKIASAFYLSEGYMGLMSALLSEDDKHPLKSSIDEAKKLVGASTFERIAAVDRLSKQKDRVPELLYALQRVYRAVLLQASDRGTTAQIKKAHHALELLLGADEMLKRNPNTKLLLTDLFLNI